MVHRTNVEFFPFGRNLGLLPLPNGKTKKNTGLSKVLRFVQLCPVLQFSLSPAVVGLIFLIPSGLVILMAPAVGLVVDKKQVRHHNPGNSGEENTRVDHDQRPGKLSYFFWGPSDIVVYCQGQLRLIQKHVKDVGLDSRAKSLVHPDHRF